MKSVSHCAIITGDNPSMEVEKLRQLEFVEFDSNVVIAYIKGYSEEKGIADTNVTKLQKLLYCCYGVTLALTGKRLTTEYPYAWPYGPVFPKSLRSLSLNKLPVNGKEIFEYVCPSLLLECINKTIDLFGQFPVGKLSGWTHIAGSPWSKITQNGKVVPTRMDDLQILNFFRENVVAPKEKLEQGVLFK